MGPSPFCVERTVRIWARSVRDPRPRCGGVHLRPRPVGQRPIVVVVAATARRRAGAAGARRSWQREGSDDPYFRKRKHRMDYAGLKARGAADRLDLVERVTPGVYLLELASHEGPGSRDADPEHSDTA
jgi:hypothetical protein